MKLRQFLLYVGLLWLVSVRLTVAAEADWKQDWEVARDFSLEIDVEGFDLPSAIAMVPNPGPGPKDPYYFVTELFGKVKVVTRDRSIYTFAENFFQVAPKIPPPSTWGEIGMAGITLDPQHGYVFVSFAYHDADGILRNNVVRFSSTPVVFGLKATESKSFTEIFVADTSWVNYQIGPMVVQVNHLFVSVGDGGNPKVSQNVDFTTGKILRMTLDGKPVADNPYYMDDDPRKARNYVWALGLRNVFGMAMVKGRMFGTENGIDIDRFLEIERAGNYNWDGTDWSIGMNAPMVFGPTVGPVQLAWVGAEDRQFPEQYRSRFFMAMSFGNALMTGVASLGYDFERSRMTDVPKRVLILRPPPGGLDFTPTSIIQKMVGAVVGVDGLYCVTLYPVRHERGAKGAVLRLKHEPTVLPPSVLDRDGMADAMMVRLGCWNCHARTTSETKSKVAPSLDRESLMRRLQTRLESDSYRASLAEIDRLEIKPFVSFRDARRKMMETNGVERVRQWIANRLKDPMFDRTASAMPNFSLSDADAKSIADYLVRQSEDLPPPATKERFKLFARKFFPEQPKRRHLAGAAAIGFAAALSLVFVGSFVSRTSRRRRSNR